jgi:hypothetical protein
MLLSVNAHFADKLGQPFEIFFPALHIGYLVIRYVYKTLIFNMNKRSE